MFLGINIDPTLLRSIFIARLQLILAISDQLIYIGLAKYYDFACL